MLCSNSGISRLAVKPQVTTSWKTQDAEEMFRAEINGVCSPISCGVKGLAVKPPAQVRLKEPIWSYEPHLHQKALLSTIWDLEGKIRAEGRGKGAFLFDSSFLALFPSLFLIHFASFVTVMQNQQKAAESKYPNQSWHKSSTSLAGRSEHRLCLRSSTRECLSQHLRQKLHFLACFSFLTPSLNICLLSSRKQDKSE